MPSTHLKRCCKNSLVQGLSYCRECNKPLDEITAVRAPASRVVPIPTESASRANTSNRAWLFGMVIACLVVFAAVVVADYFVQRKAARDALALAQATPTATAVSTPTPLPSPTGTLTPTPDRLNESEPKSASPQAEIEEYLDSPTPTPTPTLPIPKNSDERIAEGNTSRERVVAATPSPVTRPTPRVEYGIVSASDVLSIYSTGKSEDMRRYRFKLDEIARLKGSFSANGGGVSVRIVSGGSTYYTSGYEVSADKIDVALSPGTYELEVSLATRGIVSFRVNLTAYYNPE